MYLFICLYYLYREFTTLFYTMGYKDNKIDAHV